MFKKVDANVSFPKLEEELLQYWDREKIFEKSVTNRDGAKRYSFYDGPPFATGTPHYGHIVASVMKDAVPRYWTMRGFQVERKWGWDCHGLPIENIAEKALGITRKKDIEEMGVEKFNAFCRSTVLRYVDEWKRVIRRVGRWADMEHAYKTMDRDYMESVWWVFRELWDRGLIYESYRSMHICPRCETTLSQSEVAEGYKNVKDLSVVAKFELAHEPGTFILAWTTTPWTLPGNVALAVGNDIVYQTISLNDSHEKYILAKERVADFFPEKSYAVIDEFPGTRLVGKRYTPLFDAYQKDENLAYRENGWKVFVADFVTTNEGTGVVHIAPSFGEDDMELGKKENLPFVQHVSMDGTMKSEVGEEFAGRSVKPAHDPQETDVEIVRYLAKHHLLFAKEKYEHSYPHCWRCDTPLLNYATSSWFVNVSAIKEKALLFAKEVEWVPAHIKEGRFGKWLEGARDWSISRQRYWASVLPIWKCTCGALRVFGSVRELEEASGREIPDLHKEVTDTIVVPCERCTEMMRRVPDVLDTWFDSGSMPYAQMHFPFDNTEQFEKSFPAEFIAEGIDQTRAWFYYLHVIATALKESPAFRHVIVNGIVLAEDGKKMSKKLKNYPDPMLLFDRYGADLVRLYLLSSPVVASENMIFSEKEVSELQRNVFRMLWNSYSFFVTYANVDRWDPARETSAAPANEMDRWIRSEAQLLIEEVKSAMESYELNKAVRAFAPFIDRLSNWYIRRSRKRFWKNENDIEKESAYRTLYEVLITLSKLMAPFTPFLADEIYRNLTGATSVHLEDFPNVDEHFVDRDLTDRMRRVRALVSIGLEKRVEAKKKVRQPLPSITIRDASLGSELMEILREELNVKAVLIDENLSEALVLDAQLTPELVLEGEAREIIRAIQEGRKKAGFKVEDRITIGYAGKESVFRGNEGERLSGYSDMIAKEVLATDVKPGALLNADFEEEVIIEKEPFHFWLKRME